MKPVIAYVDDEISNLNFYKELLSNHFTVETFSRSLELESVLSDKHFDCFILDIYMPVIDGFQLLERIRRYPHSSRTPVFFVTTNPDDETKVNSYKKGAADFIDRLVKKDELIARIESKIKSYKESSHTLKIGSLRLDLQQIDCYVNNKKIILTLIEFKIISKLMQIYPQKLSKSDLVQSIWGEDSVNANNLNSHLYNLRLKLDNWEYEITNHRFQGLWISSKESISL